MSATTSTVPAAINIFVDKDGRNVFVVKVDRNLIVKHSNTVKGLLESDPTRTDIVIKAAAKGPVEHVIHMMQKGKQPLRIGVGHEPFAKTIAILQAINALDVQPAQPQVESHVIYMITQFKVTAEQVSIIQLASDRLGKDSRIYKAMVQAVAWNVLHGGFTVSAKAAIKAVAVKHPQLDEVIREKIGDLKRRGEEHEKMLEEKQARREKREKKQAERSDGEGFY